MKTCSKFSQPYSHEVALCLFSLSAGTVNIFCSWNFTLKHLSYLVLICLSVIMQSWTHCWKGKCGFSFLSQSLPSKNYHPLPEESSLGQLKQCSHFCIHLDMPCGSWFLFRLLFWWHTMFEYYLLKCYISQLTVWGYRHFMGLSDPHYVF